MLSNGRLTKSIYPISYGIFLIPNVDKLRFDGVVDINIQFDEEVNIFAIHSHDFIMRSITLDNNKLKYKFDKDNDLLILKSETNISIGEHKLRIMYNGQIHTDMKGFYRSKYISDNQEKYILTTQFEPTDARKAFPCFDEPSFKATFDITIVHDKNLTSLSNSNIEKVGVYEDKLIIKFETTPIMSTYLVAFIIGDFEFVETQSKNNVNIKIYGTKGNKQNMSFALSVASKTLDWFEEWFGIKYPLSKLDLIGIPDFNSGAMENWGLITFRPELLYCTEETELSSKRDATITIIHEIAHQWFGNLVTMEWWTYLWLNESMATYFGWWVCDELFPEWSVWNTFIDNEYNHALELDSLNSSHSIEIPIENSKDINQIFDGISYAKGSCLVRFLASYIGPIKFREGMQNYMKKNMWKNTKSNDLWDAFDEVLESDFKIHDLMNLWLTQKGYPVLIVEDGEDVIKITQQKYLKSGKTDDTLWIIPINLYKDGVEEHYIFNTKKYEIKNNKQKYIINPHRFGFYRVMYTDFKYDLNMLSSSIQKQIINDSFALSFAALQSFTKSFKLINQIDLRLTEDYNMWNMILSNITGIYNVMKRNDDFIRVYKTYMIKHILPHAKTLFKKIGWIDIKSETSNNANLRPLLIDFLVLLNDSETINEAFKLFDKNVYKYVIQVIGKYATNVEFQKLVYLLETKSFENPQLKDQIIEGFGHAVNDEILNKLFDEIIFDKIREQDIWYILTLLSANKKAVSKTYNFIKTNWSKFLEFYKPGSSGLSYLIKAPAVGLTTNEELHDYTRFFSKPPEGTQMVIDQCCEKIQNRIQIIDFILNEKEFMELLTE